MPQEVQKIKDKLYVVVMCCSCSFMYGGQRRFHTQSGIWVKAQKRLGPEPCSYLGRRQTEQRMWMTWDGSMLDILGNNKEAYVSRLEAVKRSQRLTEESKVKWNSLVLRAPQGLWLLLLVEWELLECSSRRLLWSGIHFNGVILVATMKIIYKRGRWQQGTLSRGC